MSGNETVTLNLAPFRAALKGRSATVMQRIEWVAQNRLRSPQEIDPSEPPDMAALDWFCQAKKDPDWFFQKMVPALVPTKKELEVQAAQKDDGRALKLLDSFQEEFDAASAQRHSGQRAVSEGTDSAGQGEPVGTGGDAARRVA